MLLRRATSLRLVSQPVMRMPFKCKYELASRADPGLAEELLQGGFHGTLGQVQRCSDLLVAGSLKNPFQNRLLTFTQRRLERSFAPRCGRRRR